MGTHLTSPLGEQEPCLLFEDCGVLSTDRLARGIACPDFASPACASSGVGSLKARLAVRQAVQRVHARLREAAAETDRGER